MSFSVRPAARADWPQLSQFLHGDRPLDSLDAAEQRYLRKLDSDLACVLVAVQGHEVIGIAMAHVWDGYLMSGRRQIRFSTLSVLPEHRRRGVGRALFEGIVAWAQSVNATWLEWYASPSAVDFYRRLGYEGVTCPQPEHPFYEIELGKGVRREGSAS